MKLLPCPFCGGEAHVERFGNYRQSTIYECGSCGCRLETGEEFNHGKRWNERTKRKVIVPKGWKIVPICLTKEMRSALDEVETEDDAWSALLTAAPTPPVSDDKDRKDAERYRFLRKEWFREDDAYSWLMSSACAFLESPDELDAKIDKAMKESKK